MKTIFKTCFLILLLFFSCKEETQKQVKIKIIEAPKELNVSTKNTLDIPKRTLDSIGKKIEIDFSIEGTFEKAEIVLIKEAQGNPIEEGIPAEYEIRFTAQQKIAVIKLNTNAILIDEGDLNNDGLSELSVYQEPMNGCTYYMTTYTYKNGKFIPLFDSFLIPTGCEFLSNNAIQSKVFKQNNKIYFMDVDANNENFKEIKKQVKLW